MVAIKRIVPILVMCIVALTGCNSEGNKQDAHAPRVRIAATTTTTVAPLPPVVEAPTTTVPIVAEPQVTMPVVEAAPVVEAPVVAQSTVQSDVLACIRSHESGNLPDPWAAYNPAGPYYGAYQWLQGSWNVAAAAVGRGDLVGLPPMVPSVSPGDQDMVTLAYHNMVGDGPWGNMC